MHEVLAKMLPLKKAFLGYPIHNFSDRNFVLKIIFIYRRQSEERESTRESEHACTQTEGQSKREKLPNARLDPRPWDCDLNSRQMLN